MPHPTPDKLSARQTPRRRYKNPPIDEAVCEFRFQPTAEWDWTIPGKLHSQVASAYNGKPQEQKLVNVEVDAESDDQSHLHYGQRIFKVLLYTEDQKRAIGVGPDMLSIHMLRPYQTTDSPEESGWNDFRPRIHQALKAYRDVAHPSGVQQVSVRYINRMVFPAPVIRLEDYLRCAVPSVPELPKHINSYTGRTDYVCDDDTRLVLTQGTVEASGEIGFMLDIDVVWRGTEAASLPQALKRVDALRDIEREAFEAIITDTARELFDADV